MMRLKKLEVPAWMIIMSAIRNNSQMNGGQGYKNHYKISKATDITYSHAYAVLGVLEKKGLITVNGLPHKGKKTELTKKGIIISEAINQMIEVLKDL